MEASAQTRVDFGKRQYAANCAVCHGHTGKGDRIYVDRLKRPMTDLTVMARRKADGCNKPQLEREVTAHRARDVQTPTERQSHRRVRISGLRPQWPAVLPCARGGAAP